MATVYAILFAILAVGCVVGFVLQYIFLSRLRIQFTPAWENLGRPTLFTNNSMQNSLATLRYLWNRGYRTLEDEGFIRFAGSLRVYLICYLTYFAAFVVLFMATGVKWSA
jgi:hypothetical protein